MNTHFNTALRASTAGSILQLVELGQRPGDLIQVSEPINPLILTGGVWPTEFRTISAHVPSHPGCYILVGREQDGIHPVYVGGGGNVLQRLRTHAVPKKIDAIWFAALSSSYPILSKTQAHGVEAAMFRMMEAVDGLRLLGSAPPLVPMSAADAAAVEGATDTMKRFLNYASFPVDIVLEEDELANEAESTGNGVANTFPRTFQSYRFVPGPATVYTHVRGIGSDLDDGFLVHAGAEYRPEVSHALGAAIMDRRTRIENGDFLEEIPGLPGRFRLKRSIVVSSALVAAKVLTGYGVNDRGVWQAIDGAPAELR